MTRRILLALAALLFPLLAFADVASSREILLAADGTLFTVDSVAADSIEDLPVSTGRVLTLTVQNGDKSTTSLIPASLTGGVHMHPALAFDPDSKTLFVFWEAARNNGFSSDLLFCSYQNGKWGTATSLESAGWTLRKNLRIAITRKTEVENPGEDESASLSEINVHAVWWQDSGKSQVSRYAMLTIAKGNVSSIFVADASDFVKHTDPLDTAPVANDVTRFPAVLESPTHDAVELVFGDATTATMHQVKIKPVASINGRLRIPIGVKVRDLPILTAAVPENADVSAIASPGDGVAFYFSSGNTLKYFVLSQGKWTAQSVSLNAKVTRDAAVEALRRMIASE